MERFRVLLENIGCSIGSLAVRRKYTVLLLVTGICLLLATGAQKLSFTPDYRAYFSNDNPELNAFIAFQDTYTKNDNFFFVLVPRDGNVFSKSTLAAVSELTDKAWTIPFANRVDSIANFQHTYSKKGELVVDDLIREPGDMSDSDREAKRSVAVEEPILVGQLVDRKGMAAAVNVVLQLPGKSLHEVPTAASKAREFKNYITQKYPNIDVYLTGFGMLNNAFGESAYMDSTQLTPIMYGVLILLGLAILRSIAGALATVAVAFLSVIVGLGVGGFFGVLLTPVSTSIPIIILTVAVADSVHIFFSLRKGMVKGFSKNDAIIEAVRVNFIPVTVTSITTVTGFLSLNFSDAPPYWHLGNLSAVGIAAGWVLSVTLFPAILAILPYRVRKAESLGLVDGVWRWLGMTVEKRAHIIAMVGLATAIGLSMLVPTIQFNDQWSDYFSKKIEFRTDTDEATKHFGLYPVEYSVPAKGPQGISEPEYLSHLDRFAQFLRGQEHVRHVYSITDILKRIHKNIHDDKDEYYTIPKTNVEAVDDLFLYELSLPYGLDLNDRINIDKSATRVTVTLGKTSTAETKEFIQSAKKWIDKNFPEYMKDTKPTSAHIMFTYITDRNVESMMSGAGLAVLLIAIVLALSLGSLKLGIYSLLSNAFPILMGFGIWAIMVGTVGFSVAAVAAISLGIVVDDTVHFLHKYHAARKYDHIGREEALVATFESVGPAVISSSIILVSGFLVMATSSFKMNVDLGLLSAITISCALLFDLIVLPALLVLFDRGAENVPRKSMELGNVQERKIQQTGVPLGLVLFVVLLVTSGYPDAARAGVEDPAKKGYVISEASDKTDLGFSNSVVNVTMVLRNAMGKEARRKLVLKTLEKKSDDEGDKTIGIFYEPLDMKGTALLTHAKILEPDAQWLYMKSIKRVKRISSRNKSGPFLGSEFAYEDFTALELKKYSHEWVREENCRELMCQVIKRLPKYEYSGYSHMLVWIDDKIKQVRKIQFYDRKGDLLKTLTLTQYNDAGGYWRPHRSIMENHQTRKTTELIYGEYAFNRGLTSRDFLSQKLVGVQ
ncbi:MAG: outer membrane lipoprotein-sorting protein [Candidatus Thiodiazotropha sp.]